MTAYELRSYPGAAAATELTADLASNGLSFSVSAGTGSGYPDGSGGPFFVIVDYDTSKAEKIRVTSRINDTFTVASVGDRGVDGTTAQAHTSGATVRACWTATDAQEANRAAANTVGLVTSKGDLLAGTGAHALGRVAAGANGLLLQADSSQTAGVKWSNTGVALDTTSSIGGVSGTSLVADRAAWTDVSATIALSNITSGNYTLSAHQLVSGKRCIVSGRFSITNTSTGLVTLVGLLPYAHGVRMLGSALVTRGNVPTATVVFGNGVAGTTTAVFPVPGVASLYFGQSTYTFASGDAIDFVLEYETM